MTALTQNLGGLYCSNGCVMIHEFQWDKLHQSETLKVVSVSPSYFAVIVTGTIKNHDPQLIGHHIMNKLACNAVLKQYVFLPGGIPVSTTVNPLSKVIFERCTIELLEESDENTLFFRLFSPDLPSHVRTLDKPSTPQPLCSNREPLRRDESFAGSDSCLALTRPLDTLQD